ncbi:phosphatase PAP2 family protein [Chitinophaga silvatica]|uniref:Phosphatase PAP2 family protein n=1 Tax=Chitinophaga silvatica TaxID=2282649 RepID=A0A3E1Y2Z3_9BACT|nr:phosphatase PAP2 family protein [Chitinophaga silvatica]RFS19080.1 phosphatase PAP2 family protein [Chitinophaga silvatica]
MNSFIKKFLKVYEQVKLLVWPLLTILIIFFIWRLIADRATVYLTINSYHTRWGDVLFPLVTQLGSVAAAVLLSLLFVIIRRPVGYILATAYMFTATISFSLKVLVGYPRPYRYFMDKLHELYFVPGVEVLNNFRSFPSGHSVCAFTAATVLSYYSRNKYWSFLFLFLAVLVAYSRMYLNQHFLEDVSAGAVIGVFFSMIWLSFFADEKVTFSGK